MAVFATVLALAACGTDIPDDPSLTVGPSLPSEDTGEADGAEKDDGSDPTATPSAVQAPTATPSNATSRTAATPPTATETVAQAAATSTQPPDRLPDYASPGETLTQDAAGQPQLLVDGVRLGRHDGFDRVVLDLSGTGEVGWTAKYVTDPALDGSGAPVDLAGDFVLRVDLQGMAYPEPGTTAYEDGVLVVDGGDLTTVTEILRTVPFEGQVPVFVGTSSQAPFRVMRLSGPERLVIDVQH